jgi:hypothetical protein
MPHNEADKSIAQHADAVVKDYPPAIIAHGNPHARFRRRYSDTGS